MDPNRNLAEQEHLLVTLAATVGPVPEEQARMRELRRDLRDLRELRRDLREWLGTGGAEPDWSVCPQAARYYGH